MYYMQEGNQIVALLSARHNYPVHHLNIFLMACKETLTRIHNVLYSQLSFSQFSSQKRNGSINLERLTLSVYCFLEKGTRTAAFG